jgi:hypothetical protein
LFAVQRSTHGPAGITSVAVRQPTVHMPLCRAARQVPCSRRMPSSHINWKHQEHIHCTIQVTVAADDYECIRQLSSSRVAPISCHCTVSGLTKKIGENYSMQADSVPPHQRVTTMSGNPACHSVPNSAPRHGYGTTLRRVPASTVIPAEGTWDQSGQVAGSTMCTLLDD